MFNICSWFKEDQSNTEVNSVAKDILQFGSGLYDYRIVDCVTLEEENDSITMEVKLNS